MTNYSQQPELVLAFEKDDENNPTGMQMRVWKLDNGTTVLIRALKHNFNAHKKLWNGERTNGDVDKLMLSLLRTLGVIKEEKNWDYANGFTNSLMKQDEYEEKEKCFYFAWFVKKSLLDF
jgi:hypothetical protein